MDFPTLETYAMPAATQALLDDAHVNLEDWLAGEAEDAFAAQESEAFIGGDGTTRPKGVLAYETVDDAAHVWGKLGRRTSGVAGGLPAGGAGADVLVDLVASLKTAFRPGARFVMGRRMAALVRKLKDTSGGYLWQPGMEGAGASLLGYPVTEMDEMPDPAAGARALVFGDFQRGYLVVDRAGVRVLRDPYSAKPHVLFYMTRRVGGGVQNFDALKVLELSA
jgi:HK97 family phage major capsid protein